MAYYNLTYGFANGNNDAIGIIDFRNKKVLLPREVAEDPSYKDHFKFYYQSKSGKSGAFHFFESTPVWIQPLFKMQVSSIIERKDSVYFEFVYGNNAKFLFLDSHEAYEYVTGKKSYEDFNILKFEFESLDSNYNIAQFEVFTNDSKLLKRSNFFRYKFIPSDKDLVKKILGYDIYQKDDKFWYECKSQLTPSNVFSSVIDTIEHLSKKNPNIFRYCGVWHCIDSSQYIYNLEHNIQHKLAYCADNLEKFARGDYSFIPTPDVKTLFGINDFSYSQMQKAFGYLIEKKLCKYFIKSNLDYLGVCDSGFKKFSHLFDSEGFFKTPTEPEYKDLCAYVHIESFLSKIIAKL